MSLNHSYALWHQAIVWTFVSAFFLLDFYLNSKCLIYFLPRFFSTKLIVLLEGFFLLLSIANAIYCYISYLILLAKHSAKQETKNLIKVTSSSQLNKSSDSVLNTNILGKNKATCLSSISNFLDNFFKASILKPNFNELNSPLNMSYSPGNDASLSSTIGYHDSPLNKSLSSIYMQQQLDRFLLDENCDSLTENSTTNLFANSFCDEERHYKTGTAFIPSEKTDDAINQVKKFVLSKQTRSPLVSRTFSETLKRTRESSPIKSFSSKSLPQLGFGNKQRYHESDLDKIFLHYNINISNLEYYELKIRIWICNTIFRPLIEKIDDLNNVLKEKYSSLHLKIGVTTPEIFKSNLSARMELCNSYLPFILPYLRIHCNQNYLVQRIRSLAKNVALESFKWNSGSTEAIFDETDGISKNLPWSERLPTDSFIVWSAFCTYMDYHLAPCPNYLTGDFFKPFSNIYYLKGDTQPTTLHTTASAFFIRSISENPPVFEFIFNGGNDIVVPCKDSGNFWVVMLLFLAHVDKFNDSRIGFLHLSSISLDIFDN